MATLTVRDIDDAHYENLVRAARANNRSVAAEVREMIADIKPRRRKIEIVSDLRHFRAAMKAKHGILSDSTEIIRAMRDQE